MKEHLFLSVYAVNQATNGGTEFFVFDELSEADAHVRHFLTTSCGLDCYCGAEEEACLREKNGGELPELAFACPQVARPVDLQEYNGHHFYAGCGTVALFVMAIYDEATALQFKKDCLKAFELDKIFTEAADRMIEHLDCLVRSFREDVDYTVAVEQVDDLLKNEGLPLF